MKLRNKEEQVKASDAPQADNAKAKGAPAAAGFKKLSSVMMAQLLPLPLILLLLGALVQFLVLMPAQSTHQQAMTGLQADALATQLAQQLAAIGSQAANIAGSDVVLNALEDPAARQAAASTLAAAIPFARKVFIFPVGAIEEKTEDFALSFASLDLARKAERNLPTLPDAFIRDGQWLIQFARPIIDQNKKVRGSLLVILQSRALKPALKVSGSSAGSVSVIQTMNGGRQVILRQGEANGEAISRNLPVEGWSVQYTPAVEIASTIQSVFFWGLLLLAALGALLLVGLPVHRAQASIRAEIAQLNDWGQKAFAGERARLPKLNWDFLSALGESFARHAQTVDKRASRYEMQLKEARQHAAAKPAQSVDAEEEVPVAAPEPMFQNQDLLDMDMLADDEDLLGLSGAGAAQSLTESMPVEVPASIFRAYDIRGVVGETLTVEGVQAIGRAIGSEGAARGVTAICVGYDGRHSSPELARALTAGIVSTGVDVIDVGRVPTPVLYFAAEHLQTQSGVMVTGSHNPANYNGLKMVLAGTTLSGDDIQKLLGRVQTNNFKQGRGDVTRQDVRRDYIERIVGDIAVAAPLRVVVDAGNGIAGELGPKLIEELGCEVIPLYCDVDGDFPNHHPDPGKPENLKDLIARVQAEKADLGIAFDGDGDRIGVVTNSGKIIWPDRLLMLYAKDVVSRNPGADIIYDVKCTRRLAGIISEFGGRPVMWKTGHSLIKAKMKETGALLAGEMSGHVFFKERWYGFDDGLYAAARLLEILGVEDRLSDQVFADFPEDISTPEINIAVTDEGKFALVERLATKGQFGDGSLTTIDGIRVDYADGWGLCRASNTTPMLVFRFEAESEAALERIKQLFRDQLLALEPELSVTF